MEQKKLTDEEIVKALEHCSHNRSCEYCYHNDERGSGEIVCRSRLMGKSLDLIHRLQKENEELKSPKFASWKLKFFNLKDELKKELAEHEEFAKKANAEIERLTKEEYEKRKGFSREEVDEISETAIKNSRKETAEEFAEMLKDEHSGIEQDKDGEHLVIVIDEEELDEICKKITER